MRIAFKINSIVGLSLLFGSIWLALAAAGVFGWQRVSAEVGQRAQAEAGFAVTSASQTLGRSDHRFAGQARAEVGSLRQAAARNGAASLVQTPAGASLAFGHSPRRKPVAEAVAARNGGIATVFVYRGGDLVPVDSSQDNAAGALAPGAYIGAGTGLPKLIKAGRSTAGPTRLGGRAYFTDLEPITDRRGGGIGAFGASFPLETIDETTHELRNSPVFANGFFIVVDSRDNILFSASDQVPAWLADRVHSLNQGGDIQGASLDGYNITRSAPGNSGLRVIAGVSQLDLAISTIKLVGASLTFVVGVIVVAMCLGWLLARRLTDALAAAERSRLDAEQARAAAEAVGAELNAELEQAARYVESLLPVRTSQGPVAADWLYRPSASVGGDAFGYHWLDETRFAFYLLDVCGHGVGAALLATTAMSVIRAETVNADFSNPSSVLGALNDAFPMDKQNGMYFTIWYGVYDTGTRLIRFAGAGHHPAVLLAPGAEPELLGGRGPPIGCFERVEFPTSAAHAPPGAQLYVFSDGLFEVELKSGKEMMTYEDFVQIIVHWREARADRQLNKVLEVLQDIQGKPHFDDDCSLLELSFRPANQVRLVA